MELYVVIYRLPANYHADGAPNQKRVVYYREDPIVSVPYDVWVNGEQFVSDVSSAEIQFGRRTARRN